MTTRIAPTRRLLVAATALLASVATMGMAPDRVAAAPVVSGGFTTSISTASHVVARGRTLSIAFDVTSATTRQALADIEIYSAAGVKQFQQVWDRESFTAAQRRTFTARWVVPADQPLGTYLVKVGIFGSGWSSLLHWNDTAATYNVVATPPPSTTTPPTTATPAPSTTRPTTTAAPPTTPAPTAPPTTPTPTAPPTVPPTAAPTTPAPTTTRPAPTTTVAAPPAGAAFFEDFQSAAGVGRFDFQLHTTREGASASFSGEHNDACAGPDTFRTITAGQVAPDFMNVSGSQLIWHCAPSGPASGHFMTAVDTTGIATLSFSPAQTFTNVRKVCWDQNMNNLGEAKWMNFFVAPASDVAAHGGNLSYAAGSGLSFGGIDQMLPPGAFDFTWLRGSFGAHNIGGDGNYNVIFDQWGSYDANMEPTSAPRHRICIEDLENGTLRYSVYQTAAGSVQVYTGAGSLPNGPVKVIWQDASYNPTKHEGSDHTLTWHWDNIEVS